MGRGKATAAGVFLLLTAFFFSVSAYQSLASALAELRSRGPVGNFLADIALSRGLWIFLFLVTAFFIVAAFRDSRTHPKKGKEMSEKDDDKPQQDIKGEGHRIAGRDYYEQAQPRPEPLQVGDIRFTQKATPGSSDGVSFGLELTIQTNVVLSPTRLRIECDGPFEINRGRVHVGFATPTFQFDNMNQRFSENALDLYFSAPPFTPQLPLVITFYSRTRIKVLQVIRIP